MVDIFHVLGEDAEREVNRACSSLFKVFINECEITWGKIPFGTSFNSSVCADMTIYYIVFIQCKSLNVQVPIIRILARGNVNGFHPASQL